MIGRLEFESGFFAVFICRNSEITAEIGVTFLDRDGLKQIFARFRETFIQLDGDCVIRQLHSVDALRKRRPAVRRRCARNSFRSVADGQLPFYGLGLAVRADKILADLLFALKLIARRRFIVPAVVRVRLNIVRADGHVLVFVLEVIQIQRNVVLDFVLGVLGNGFLGEFQIKAGVIALAVLVMHHGIMLRRYRLKRAVCLLEHNGKAAHRADCGSALNSVRDFERIRVRIQNLGVDGVRNLRSIFTQCAVLGYLGARRRRRHFDIDIQLNAVAELNRRASLFSVEFALEFKVQPCVAVIIDEARALAAVFKKILAVLRVKRGENQLIVFDFKYTDTILTGEHRKAGFILNFQSLGEGIDQLSFRIKHELLMLVAFRKGHAEFVFLAQLNILVHIGDGVSFFVLDGDAGEQLAHAVDACVARILARRQNALEIVSAAAGTTPVKSIISVNSRLIKRSNFFMLLPPVPCAGGSR